jgi:hypothetical protein
MSSGHIAVRATMGCQAVGYRYWWYPVTRSGVAAS